VDGNELAVRAVLGQQVSVAGARTLAGRLAAKYGEPLAEPADGLTHAFPRAEVLATMDPADLAMPAARKRALLGLCAALADGSVVIDPGVDRLELIDRLVRLPGIGPWTAGYIAMRALGDPDVFLPTDLGIRHAVERLGADGDPRALAALAERWRPWRSYALHHLWASLSNPPLDKEHST
jgi:AraC family transcriptional regulator of adaptative response / DNA-3-methyladenine glycosylase II